MSQDSIVYVVDDDSAMRKAVCLALETAGLPVKSYASAEEFLGDYSRERAGCIVLDLSMPGMNGLECLQQMRAQGVHVPVLIVSGTATVPSAVQAMKLGAVDFLEKPLDHRIVLTKVQDALAQHVTQRASAAEVEAGRRRMCQLTERERELLKLVVSGKSNKQIADDMGISVKTVANHRANLMEKTGALNAADLVRLAMITGMQ